MAFRRDPIKAAEADLSSLTNRRENVLRRLVDATAKADAAAAEQRRLPGEASVEKSSFGESTGGLGGLIQKASYGGGTGGSGEARGLTALGDPHVRQRFEAFLRNRGYLGAMGDVGRTLEGYGAQRRSGSGVPLIGQSEGGGAYPEHMRGPMREAFREYLKRKVPGYEGGPMVPGIVPGGPADRVGRALRGDAPDGGAALQGANPSDYKDVLDHIAKSEGTAHKAGGGYNTSLGYGRYLPGGKEQNLTSMTLNEIGALGRHMRRQPGNPNSSALGRYQIVGDTMRRLQKRMGLSGDELFDEKMQDRMAAELARDRGANPRGLQQEWASLVGEKNRRAVELMRRIPRGASTVPRDRPPREVADGEGWAARERARKQIDAPALPTFSARVRELQEQADRNRLNFDSPGMSKALRAGVNGGPTINNDGRVEVHVARPGPDTKVSTSASGNLFRDVKLNRGATMAQASQEN